MAENINNNEVTVFAETNYRGKNQKFGIKRDDRRKHMYVIGKSGMGKSVLLKNMIIQDIQNGHGVGIVDPHGDLAEELLDFVPASRISDVVYFNPADVDYPIAFNVLESVDEEHKHLVASGLMGVFKKLWPDVWSARMEYILNNTILSLLDYSGSTMLGINRMLSDRDFREKVVANITDPLVKSFWVNEFAKYTDRLASEATASVQNKVGQFLSAAILRNIIGQPKSTIDMRQIMDSNKIFIANLSKGRIGEDNMKLLGGMLITKIQLAAMERVDIAEEERKDFYLYVDEFQNFATESFATILSEARKYRLNLIVAHQYIAQMKDEVRDAVFGNIGTLLSFRVGAADAEFLEKEFEPIFTMNDLVNLDRYNVYLKLLIDGVTGDAFSANTLSPAVGEDKEIRDKIINASRERYANNKAEVEEKISRWIDVDKEKVERKQKKPFDDKKNIEKQFSETNFKKSLSNKSVDKPKMLEEEKKQSNENLNEAICAKCGKKTYVFFIPDGKRPVYCKECLQEVRKNAVNNKKNVKIEEPKEIPKPVEMKEKKGIDFVGLKDLISGAMNEIEKKKNIIKQPQVEKNTQDMPKYTQNKTKEDQNKQNLVSTKIPKKEGEMKEGEVIKL